jgi:hypothetical protein
VQNARAPARGIKENRFADHGRFEKTSLTPMAIASMLAFGMTGRAAKKPRVRTPGARAPGYLWVRN